MFGKRTTSEPVFQGSPAAKAAKAAPEAPPRVAPAEVKNGAWLARRPQSAPAASKPAVRAGTDSRSEDYYQIKSTIFNALIDTIDLAQLAQLDPDSARGVKIRDIVNEIISLKSVVRSIAEQESLLQDICNDVLGYGPLEPLLARDDIADIMVNGANRVFIEVGGKGVQLTNIRFRDNAQLMNICQRIVSQVGRRVDESSPICDARLLDGSRVNVIAPPLSLDGATLTIRKFKKDKLTLEDLVKFGSISPDAARVLQVIGRCRCNILISGGTGFGQDHAAQLYDRLYRHRGTHHHLRRRRRTSAAAAACGAAGNPAAQPGRPGHDLDARPGQELSAHAPRTHHRGRSARTRSL